MRHRALGVYTLCHFVVDFVCFWFLFGRIAADGHVGVFFLFYNILAFGLQPLIGYLFDRRRMVYRDSALLGLALLLAGIACAGQTMLALCLLGVANACFHVGAGADTLISSGGKMAPNGVFVASGAMGVSLGTMAGRAGTLPAALVAGLTLLFAGLVWFFCPRRGLQEETRRQFSACSVRMREQGVIALCFLSILVRAYVGFSAPAPALWALAPSLCALAGKVLGGFAADVWGARRVGVGSLLISGVCLCLLGSYAPTFMAGLVLFNMTMSITLCAIADVLQDTPGFAFGITTLALLIGSVPAFFFRLERAVALPLCLGLIVLSALLLCFATRNRKGEISNDPFVCRPNQPFDA